MQEVLFTRLGNKSWKQWVLTHCKGYNLLLIHPGLTFDHFCAGNWGKVGYMIKLENTE